MSGRLGKLSILFLVLTVCLAAVGAGHGHWSGSLEISGTAKVEQLCVEFVEQETNDPPGHNYVPGIPGADESIADGFVGNPFRLDKDVGWTECFLFDTDDDGLDDTIEFNIYNAYPCYLGKMIATIGNCGEIPVQVDSVSVSFPQYPGGEYDWTSPPTVAPWPHPPEFEVKWVNGVANVPIVIPPDEVTLIGVWVHVLQPAAQGAEYTFRMTVHVSGPA
jgi:hypothetical protein